jgi:hypothetical protein
MASKEVWIQLAENGSEPALKPIEVPDDWDASTDLFYLDSIWLDTDGSVTYVVSATPDGIGVASEGLGVIVDGYSGLEIRFPNPLVLAEGYCFHGTTVGTTARVTMYGRRVSSKANTNLAMVGFGVMVYETAPTIRP